MTPQQHADDLLHVWQRNRALPPERRLQPHNDNTSAEDFDRDLAVIRAVIERRN